MNDASRRPRLDMSAVALGALLLGSCVGRPARPVVSAPAPGPPASASLAVDRKCGAGERQAVGPYVYVNNQWGSGKVPAGQPFEQCLLSRTVGGSPQHGWSFRWPGHDPSVFAYPEIIFGWTPWGGGESSDPRFPMPVRDMPALEMTYAVESVIEGHFNLAPEVWLVRTGGDGPRRPSDIATEIMFWLDYDETMRPSGSVVATVTVDGVAYDLYKAEGGNEKASWTYLAYVGPRGRSAGSLRLDAFIRDAVARGYASEAHHLAGVEFGNECAGGDGTTWVTRYEVRVGR